MLPKVAIATIVESREDFYQLRKPLIAAELASIEWLRQSCEYLESEPIRSAGQVKDFSKRVHLFGAQALIVHIPIWGDPAFTLKLVTQTRLPTLILGNDRADTSSIVGVLGAGGALDQAGYDHTRIIDHADPQNWSKVLAFLRAAYALAELRGQTLGLFGGRSLGIITAAADPAQWQHLFGVDIETIDQLEIVQVAEEIPDQQVQEYAAWLSSQLAGIRFSGLFTRAAFEKQIRSYLATNILVEHYGLDFVGVKCQPELSDGYVTQCISHMLCNSHLSPQGEKAVTVHACESDADGALTMQILHLLAGGKPAALLDVRWYDRQRGLWTLANCGALPPAYFASPGNPTGLAGLSIQEHVFGLGGGGAIPGFVQPQPVTLARLCRRNGVYWMAILAGEALQADEADLERATPVFPKAFIRMPAALDFLQVFGSNHIHLVSGRLIDELVAFCHLAGIETQVWLAG